MPFGKDDVIRELDDNEVFVFGSNSAGRHGKGAALAAMRFGAKYGQGEGHYGRTYAIPTKDRHLRRHGKKWIKSFVDKFLYYARENPQYTFLVTAIGCGLSGYKVEDIAPMFKDSPSNVILNKRFKCHIES